MCQLVDLRLCPSSLYACYNTGAEHSIRSLVNLRSYLYSQAVINNDARIMISLFIHQCQVLSVDSYSGVMNISYQEFNIVSYWN